MYDHINRGGYRYGKHIRNHLMPDPRPYVRYEPTMMEVVAEVAARVSLSLTVLLAVVAAAVSAGI